MRDSDFTVAVGDNGVGVNVGPLIINFQHFSRIGIVINRHSLVANNRHAADLAGMKPAHMDMSRHPVSEAEVEMSNIMDTRLQVSMSLHFDLFRLLAR